MMCVKDSNENISMSQNNRKQFQNMVYFIIYVIFASRVFMEMRSLNCTCLTDPLCWSLRSFASSAVLDACSSNWPLSNKCKTVA